MRLRYEILDVSIEFSNYCAIYKDKNLVDSGPRSGFLFKPVFDLPFKFYPYSSLFISRASQNS